MGKKLKHDTKPWFRGLYTNLLEKNQADSTAPGAGRGSTSGKRRSIIDQ